MCKIRISHSRVAIYNIKTSMYVILLVSNFSQEDKICHNVACENIHNIKIQIIAITDLNPDIEYINIYII